MVSLAIKLTKEKYIINDLADGAYIVYKLCATTIGLDPITCSGLSESLVENRG